LRLAFGTEIVSFVSSVGNVELRREHWCHPDGRSWSRREVDEQGQLQMLRHPAHWKRHVAQAVDSHADASGVVGGGSSALPGDAVGPAGINKSPQAPGAEASAAAAKAQAAADAVDEAAFVAGMAKGEYDDIPCYLAWDGAVLGGNGKKLGVRGGHVPADAKSTASGASELALVSEANCTDELVPVRCPHPATAARIASLIRVTKAAQDSIGGTVVTVAHNVPVGLGEPAFDKAEAMLAHAMLSLPATKGFEIGSGFLGTRLNGSEHNDAFVGTAAMQGSPAVPSSPGDTSGEEPADAGHVVPSTSTTTALLAPSTNNAGGTLGGITSGAPLVFRVAVKPVSTIGRAQETASFEGHDRTLEAKGRHDPCVLPRTPPLTEAMTALVLADLALQQAARVGSAQRMLESAAGVAVQQALLSGPSMPVLPASMQASVPVRIGEGAGSGKHTGLKRPRE
jgi:hypothetical protein